MKVSIGTAAALLAMVATASTSATAQQKGATCLEQCRTDLKQRGLWSTYPYGYCRNKCSHWLGAEKDPFRPKKK
jgi:hypothetical protein